MKNDLWDSYRYHRQRGCTANYALTLARQDVAANKTRYPSSGGVNVNPPFQAYGETMRWIETPSHIGLRTVGFADEIDRSIKHTGWYTDDDGDMETVRGIVYQFPARDGKPRYVYGFADPCNDGPACLSLDETDDKTQAARWADDIARKYGESEREYRRAWDAGRRFEELGDDIAAARKSCLALIREAKAACETLTSFAAIKATIRANVISYRDDIAKARAKREKLLSEYGEAAGFKDS